MCLAIVLFIVFIAFAVLSGYGFYKLFILLVHLFLHIPIQVRIGILLLVLSLMIWDELSSKIGG